MPSTRESQRMECGVNGLSRVCGVIVLLLLRGLRMGYEAFRDINIVDCLLSDRHPDKILPFILGPTSF
jgi:hypothetical protein